MKSLVVLFALCAVACGSYIAQPPHHPAIVLDPHGRPLDTAEVIAARALHLQAKALEHHHAPLVHAAPLAYAVSPLAYGAAPLSSAYSPYYGHGLGYNGLHGHYLKKRSLAHFAYAPAAVSHQSRVDYHSSPAVVAHHAVPLHHAPLVAHVAPAAVSHQSRVDYRSYYTPLLSHHGVYAAAPYAQHGLYSGHYNYPYAHAW